MAKRGLQSTAKQEAAGVLLLVAALILVFVGGMGAFVYALATLMYIREQPNPAYLLPLAGFIGIVVLGCYLGGRGVRCLDTASDRRRTR